MANHACHVVAPIYIPRKRTHTFATTMEGKVARFEVVWVRIRQELNRTIELGWRHGVWPTNKAQGKELVWGLTSWLIHAYILSTSSLSLANSTTISSKKQTPSNLDKNLNLTSPLSNFNSLTTWTGHSHGSSCRARCSVSVYLAPYAPFFPYKLGCSGIDPGQMACVSFDIGP